MNWVAAISMDALDEFCPELTHIRTEHSASADQVLEQVRELKATIRERVAIPYDPKILRHTRFHPTGEPIDDDYIEVSRKNYALSDVVELDRVKSTYWAAVKAEVHTLVCTSDRKYAALRTQLTSLGSKGSQAIVAAVASAIGQFLGVAAGVIGGLVAIVLFAALRVGINAYCKTVGADSPLPTEQPKPSGRGQARATPTKRGGESRRGDA